jgi:hypothetical protein
MDMVSCIGKVASRTKYSKTSEKTISSFCTYINLSLEPAFSAYEDPRSPLMAHEAVARNNSALEDQVGWNI